MVPIPYTCEELAPIPNTSEEFSDNFRREKNSCDLLLLLLLFFVVVFFFFGGGGRKELVTILYTCEELAPNPNTSEDFSGNF